jgi:putative oxidoreductase
MVGVGPTRQSWSIDAGLFVIRAMLAAVFMFHGSQKLFGWFGGPGLAGTAEFMGKMGIPGPAVSAVLAGSAEFFGGLALLLGVGVRIAVIPMVFTMLVASFHVHGHAFSAQKGGMEYPLTMAVILIGLGLTGAGRVRVTARFATLKKAPGEPEMAADRPSRSGGP